MLSLGGSGLVVCFIVKAPTPMNHKEAAVQLLNSSEAAAALKGKKPWMLATCFGLAGCRLQGLG